MDSFIPVDKVESYVESAKNLEDLPLMELIKNMEDKYGAETHMVIECKPIAGRESDELNTTRTATEEDVVWYVEFKEEKYLFEDFWEMRFHALNNFQ
tara:strand:+ start:725 stop:1015 length:291 start_codon:yes stop_codon:yes gene_type:complete